MGLFGRKKKNAIDESVYKWMTVDEALAYSRGEEVVPQAAIISALDENRALKKRIERQIEEEKAEYASVTTYLSDIQKINLAAGTEKRELIDLAQSITDLKADRESFIKNERQLKPEHYNTFQTYENVVPDQMKRMEENEKYLSLVNNDLKHLEGEKGSLRYEIDSLTDKQKGLRSFLIAMTSFAVVVFVVLFAIASITKKDMIIPFFVMAVAALSAAFYCFWAMRATTAKLLEDEAKLNRAITLLNKVKIKYVNCTSVLEYSYEKFDVNSYHEMVYRWQQYLKEKQLEERHKRNSQMMTNYRTSLARALQRLGVNDTAVWTTRPEPILDHSAMADLTLKLNDRRQKLRAAIEFANKQLSTCNDELEALVKKHPEQERVIRALQKEEQ